MGKKMIVRGEGKAEVKRIKSVSEIRAGEARETEENRRRE